MRMSACKQTVVKCGDNFDSSHLNTLCSTLCSILLVEMNVRAEDRVVHPLLKVPFNPKYVEFLRRRSKYDALI